jgi:carbonic anhydrase/acetyltransferase-like protein (isoleucine patch superfamily)
MNQINKQPISSLGYNFIPKEFIPKGKSEYYLRNIQNRSGIKYRKLRAEEIKVLEKNANSSDNWSNVLVSDAFNPKLVKNCSFFGLVRIGKLESYLAEFNNLRLPIGLYNSTIISCDIGDNVVIDNVNFMSHYIVGNEVMLVNVNELVTTDHSKFGNGVLKVGERESVRIWLEICNENAGRSVLPFNGMLAADAWLWSKYRDDEKLLLKFKEFTDSRFDTRRGYYGKIGDRTVIKNCKIIKDVWIGSDAYLKGANKLKNLTINSSPESKSQIGEGCELVNGIIGFGCRIFYGVKAVRFMMGSNSQLKYGARLINSYLGDNSTISCCEVLNSLIFPAHEQHHNNSFLCAATVMGQSNMAAGVTIGSNHNSRGADGELVAGRGFWPGLCVSLKHNSKFASFTLIAKGNFPAELNISVPFSLVSNDVSNDRLTVMPGYWFMYNMYALARNARKYAGRDKRMDKTQMLEYDFLAPDSVNELFDGLKLMKEAAAKAWAIKNKKHLKEKDLLKTGELLLSKNIPGADGLEILAEGFENSRRKVELIKVPEAYRLFNELIVYYGISELVRFIDQKNISSWQQLLKALPAKPMRNTWKNIGGQLMPESAVKSLLGNIRTGKTGSWDEAHSYYRQKSESYHTDKFRHAFASLLEVLKLTPAKFRKKLFLQLLQQAGATKEWMVRGIYESRAKDYSNPFRQMVYETEKEMEKVIGALKDNSFIKEQQASLSVFREKVNTIKQQFS